MSCAATILRRSTIPINAYITGDGKAYIVELGDLRILVDRDDVPSTALVDDFVERKLIPWLEPQVA